MKHKIVLIGDITASKKLRGAERGGLQEDLTALIDEINKNAAYIESPMTITLGDEFQAVYSNAESLLADTWKIMAGIHPVNVRFSIGIGEIVTPINKKQALGMDGPAFYAAREGIKALKKSGRIYRVMKAGETDSDTNSGLRLLNRTLDMLSNEMSSWRKSRFDVLLKLSAGVPVKDIAGELGLSATAVYKNKDEGDLDLVIEIGKTAAVIINEKLEELST